jgi:hypothetical protein
LSAGCGVLDGEEKSPLQFQTTLVPCYIVGFSVIAVTDLCLLGVVFVLGE